jgi:chemotaxis protein MotB
MTDRSGPTTTVPWAITFADMALLLLCFFIMLSAVAPKTDSLTTSALPAVSTETAPEAKVAADAAALIRARFARGIDEGWLAVDQLGPRIQLRFGTADGFDLGSDRPTARTLALIDTLADSLGEGDARITVAGHTDDLPISNGRFRDNWDLSSARAVSVIRELVIRHGIDPARLEAKGHADTRPLTRNGSAKDRARNRRIEIEIAWQR